MATAGQAAIQLPAVFSDHMVLQREMAVPVWGTAEPRETVTVSFRGQEKTATADARTGAWKVMLDALNLGEPGELKVSGSKSAKALVFTDVLVGDVWVGSGQSNMAGPVVRYAENDPILAEARDAGPHARIRLFHIGKPPGAWQEATAENADKFSALLFAFGESLHRELEVPIGLMLGAVGGTPSGMWLSEAAFSGDAKVQAEIKAFAATYDHDKALKNYHEVVLPKWQTTADRFKAEGKKLPRKPNPPAPAGGSTRGGVQGALYERYIRPALGYGIRGVLWDQGESGTGIVGATQLPMMQALIAGWRKEWGQGEFPFLFVQKPSGGGCAFSADDPVTREADAFTPLPVAAPTGGGEQRYEYVRLMNNTPGAYMVSASDLGGMVHPINKWGYGQRAALVAQGAAYESGVVWSGPSYREHVVEDGGKVRVSFDHVGDGLVAVHSGTLQGFELAGADGKFIWADAVIEGDQVVVSSAQVADPKAVRFGFSKLRSWANLFNKAGLPALVFSTEAK